MKKNIANIETITTIVHMNPARCGLIPASKSEPDTCRSFFQEHQKVKMSNAFTIPIVGIKIRQQSEKQMRQAMTRVNQEQPSRERGWQRYASSVWDDIRIDNVLPFRDSREEDDEKHVHPLQLDVIDRLIELYSNEGEVVLTPFMGVGSEVYSPVSMGRKAIGIELKDSYFKQAKINLELASKRFTIENGFKQEALFETELDLEA